MRRNYSLTTVKLCSAGNVIPSIQDLSMYYVKFSPTGGYFNRASPNFAMMQAKISAIQMSDYINPKFVLQYLSFIKPGRSEKGNKQFSNFGYALTDAMVHTSTPRSNIQTMIKKEEFEVNSISPDQVSTLNCMRLVICKIYIYIYPS